METIDFEAADKLVQNMYHVNLRGHLNTVFEMFLNLLPPDLQELVKQDVYFAGGCIVNFLIEQPIQDYDLFIKTGSTRDALRAYFDLHRDWCKSLTANAVTYQTPSGHVFQLVTRFTGTPERVFKSFDFEHCKAYYDPATGELVYNSDIILKKKLVYTGEDDYPLNTMKRLVKFVRRGWDIDNESILNLAKKMNKTDLSDPVVYAEQTIGFYGSSMR